MSEIELKPLPCPFCGSEPRQHPIHKEAWQHSASSIYAMCPLYAYGLINIEHWNTRTNTVTEAKRLEFSTSHSPFTETLYKDEHGVYSGSVYEEIKAQVLKVTEAELGEATVVIAEEMQYGSYKRALRAALKALNIKVEG